MRRIRYYFDIVEENMNNMQLFCFPNAGASSMFFSQWEDSFKNNIQLLPIDIPGRGTSSEYRECDNYQDVIDMTVEIIHNQAKEPFAFLGHCSGGFLAFEVANTLIKKYGIQPIHIFLSSLEPLNQRENVKKIADLSQDEFVSELLKRGGINKEVLENEYLFNYFIPNLRKEIKLYEDYVYVEKSIDIDCVISIMYGRDDHRMNDVNEWKRYIKKNLNIVDFDGNHFYINGQLHEVIEYIIITLENYI